MCLHNAWARFGDGGAKAFIATKTDNTDIQANTVVGTWASTTHWQDSVMRTKASTTNKIDNKVLQANMVVGTKASTTHE